MFKIPKDIEPLIIRKLEQHLFEYISLSQELSFNGAEADRLDLNEYVSTVFEFYFKLITEGTAEDWNWEMYRDIKLQWNGEEVKTEEDIVQSVIFNLGKHSNSLHTGEKWIKVPSEDPLILSFEPVSGVNLKISDLNELKGKYDLIRDIEYVCVASESGVGTLQRLHVHLYRLD